MLYIDKFIIRRIPMSLTYLKIAFIKRKWRQHIWKLLNTKYYLTWSSIMHLPWLCCQSMLSMGIGINTMTEHNRNLYFTSHVENFENKTWKANTLTLEWWNRGELLVLTRCDFYHCVLSLWWKKDLGRLCCLKSWDIQRKKNNR